ncbi:O-acyltransferase like protein-like [Hyposmocoma kahamanoa]|uniref:O-acyltransferase like protein-like n=1 Tax=Hyposmocoma kahamanoa TaxID=1477025 RepID=UPI000E6D725C|nr:O-acyltransferase like protein-like [Hyposmocoma kahamanoa]
MVDKVNGNENNRAIDTKWEAKHPAFDPNIYEEILDPDLCTKQLEYLILNDTLLMMTFLEAGPRIPRGILQGNFQDLGNYHQCLGINREIDHMVIAGKYCHIGIGLSDLEILGDTIELDNAIKAIDTVKDEIHLYERLGKNLNFVGGIERKKTLRTDAVTVSNVRFTVAICVPKPCSVRQALPNLIGTELIHFEEHFCRFKNDKPWAPGLYVAIVVFSLIGLLTILSTSYDIWNTLIRKRDPKSLNTICLSFSAYTNSRRLITFKPVRGTLECVDGIRAITMAWIVIGHSFGVFPPLINNIDYFRWIMSFGSIWLTTAYMAVDTFFMLSGLMVVYTTVGKFSSMKLLKKLHLFYLNRLVRLYPLLATTVLLQASVVFYMYDGAMWTLVGFVTEECRTNWWLTLLYVQNFFQPICVSHSWYLAIDMQLYVLSPLVLVWVLSGKKKRAWSALIVALLVSLTASSIYNFVNNFPGSTIQAILEVNERYGRYYYFNTLTRCSPFFVGMCFGYLIHFWREKRIRLTRILNYILWIVNLTILWLAFYVSTPMKRDDYDNQTLDNIANSFMRPAWALGLGWIIIACAEGYGGPINWFLSLQIWKLPSRLSYALYLLHAPIQIIIVGAASQHVYFTVSNFFYIFCSQSVIIFIVSFVITILVDSPCSTLFKEFLQSGLKKSESDQQGDERATKNQPVTSQQQNESAIK